MSKIPVYFMPGLAASSSIFERIKLDENIFETYLLEWEIPNPKESLSDYALRISKNIKHENPVLIGVSFGGILVQEISKHIKARKVIIISSVRSNHEFPRRMKIGKSTKAYKLIPMQLILNVEKLAKFSFGEKVNKRIKLYEKFLSVRDLGYLQWAVESVILWDRDQIDENVVHIHGDKDDVFPIKYIDKCILVKGGTHIMILNKYKWLNENLPSIILD
ncbi:MAG: alpha/beta hydrolase [Flavobacterium nitrogenifigens]|uniref:Pimeloyl-ACP methyl ester carboxylesterase n=1 Tax=Flavobacterium nitrogenifigens TaxID=1617283 RepID=A0A521EJG1_9FLAO|nr:alpha/beta hydrolase [Flavobacterium nitrogenifigens]MDQ8012293.1 alpha/beta hydrolase [Flavobacterium nitrogenifigens]SMO84058.1 Pimeloyl-ACP methyl ester carboxylesterase [Flavobacterium nitrogenifigens]